MQNLGIFISTCALALAGIVLLRGVRTQSFKLFPLFYSYIFYAFCGSVILYTVYWLDPQAYASAYWLYFLVSILVEFSVLIEVSDHIFERQPAIRKLGRALTVVISTVFALFYVFPVIFSSSGRRPALFAFALRASVTKVVVLAVLLMAARYYRSDLGKNVAGLMMGFSIYLGVNIANLAAAKAFSPKLYAHVFWIMTPTAYTLCLLVWMIGLWDLVVRPTQNNVFPVMGRHSGAVSLELTRYNAELSKLLQK
jgi:hypothetical protein